MVSGEWRESVRFLELPKLEEEQRSSGKAYLEFLRLPEMSAGLYVLPAGGSDPQKPHKEAEVYCVMRGRGHMKAGEEDRVVGEGSIIFVAPGIEHRFYGIEEELAVLVLFAPAESG